MSNETQATPYTYIASKAKQALGNETVIPNAQMDVLNAAKLTTEEVNGLLEAGSTLADIAAIQADRTAEAIMAHNESFSYKSKLLTQGTNYFCLQDYLDSNLTDPVLLAGVRNSLAWNLDAATVGLATKLYWEASKQHRADHPDSEINGVDAYNEFQIGISTLVANEQFSEDSGFTRTGIKALAQMVMLGDRWAGLASMSAKMVHTRTVKYVRTSYTDLAMSTKPYVLDDLTKSKLDLLADSSMDVSELDFMTLYKNKQATYNQLAPKFANARNATIEVIKKYLDDNAAKYQEMVESLESLKKGLVETTILREKALIESKNRIAPEIVMLIDLAPRISDIDEETEFWHLPIDIQIRLIKAAIVGTDQQVKYAGTDRRTAMDAYAMMIKLKKALEKDLSTVLASPKYLEGSL